jgi:hypothetical protein
MSRHMVIDKNRQWVFGWDQNLQSYFLQIHDDNLDEDDNPEIWLGATADTAMPELEDLDKAAREHGLKISNSTKLKLYYEKDHGV